MIVTLFIPADSDRHHNLFNLFLFFIIHSDFYSFLKFRIQISCHIYSVSHFWTPHRHITHLMSYLSIFQLQQLSWSGSFRSFVFLCFVYEWILKFCPLSLYFDFCAIHDNSQVLFVILHFVLFSYACNWNSVLFHVFGVTDVVGLTRVNSVRLTLNIHWRKVFSPPSESVYSVLSEIHNGIDFIEFVALLFSWLVIDFDISKETAFLTDDSSLPPDYIVVLQKDAWVWLCIFDSQFPMLCLWMW